MDNENNCTEQSFNSVINLVKKLNKNKKKVKKPKLKTEEPNFIEKFNNKPISLLNNGNNEASNSSGYHERVNKINEDKNITNRESMLLSIYSGRDLGKEKMSIYGFENNRLSSEFNFDLTNIYTELNKDLKKDCELGIVEEEKERERQHSTFYNNNFNDNNVCSPDESPSMMRERVSRHQRGMNPYLNTKNSIVNDLNEKLDDNNNDFFNIIDVERNYIKDQASKESECSSDIKLKTAKTNSKNFKSKVLKESSKIMLKGKNSSIHKNELNEYVQINDELDFNMKEIEESIKTDDEEENVKDLSPFDYKMR